MLLLAFFVLGRGPGTLVWLSGSTPPWLPFAGRGLSWLPYYPVWLPFGSEGTAGRGSDPSLKPVGAIQPGASPTASATPTPTPGPTPTPNPSGSPTPMPSGSPTPTPSPSDSHSPTPTPSASDSPTPTPAPTSTPTPTPTPTPFQPVVLYSDNFEADLPLLLPPSGWTNEPPGLLGLNGYTVTTDGSKVMKGPGGSTGFPSAVAGSSSWTNYKVSADLKVDPANGHARVITRHPSAGNLYACGLDHDGGGQLFLGRESGGSWGTFSTAPYAYSGSTWYRVDFSAQGSSLTCTVTEPGSGRTATITASDGKFASGSIGETGEYASEYDNFVVSSLP